MEAVVKSSYRLHFSGLGNKYYFHHKYFNFIPRFYGWGSTASRLQSHYEEAVYILPLISQTFLVFI